METRSMGTSSSGVWQRGMLQRLPWWVIIGRWVGAQCRGGGMVG